MIEECNYALQIDNSNTKALYRRGIAYSRLSQYKEAIRDLSTGTSKILRKFPEILIFSKRSNWIQITRKLKQK